jgi:predicted nucleic acid-binding Zn finger protein
MFIEKVKVSRGATVRKGDRVESAEVELVVEGVDGEWDKAHKKASGIAEQLIGDWVKEMGAGLPVPAAMPTSVLVLEPPEPTVSLFKPVPLVFSATGSKERSQRIMRAMSEKMTFTPGEGNVWICMTETRVFHVISDFPHGLGFCDCEDFLHRGEKYQMPCKHLYALTIEISEFWDKAMDIPVPRRVDGSGSK